MARRGHDQKPLWRKENRRTHSLSVQGRGGPEYRWQWHSKAEKRAEAQGVTRGAMKRGAHHGLDLTPLFHFLLSKVGEPWEPVHREASARLPDEAPIFWMVRENPGRLRQPYIAGGEHAYLSRLFVDEGGLLQQVDPTFGVEDFFPYCPCHTHTFTGIVATNPCRERAFVSTSDG